MDHAEEPVAVEHRSYLVWSVTGQGWLQKTESRPGFTWTLTADENTTDGDCVYWTLLSTRENQDRVYLVNGEKAFLDTHGARHQPNVWTGWRRDLSREDIINGNTSAGRGNLWWVCDECMEGAATYSIGNPEHKVFLGVGADRRVCEYPVQDQWKLVPEPPPQCQWMFVPETLETTLSMAFDDFRAMED